MIDRATLEAAADAAIVTLALRKRAPDFWTEYIPAVQILSDDPINPRAIPFDLYDYQRATLTDWLGGGDDITLKARQLGYSWMVAAYMLYCARFRGWATAYYSLGDREAIAELDRIRFIWTRLPDSMKCEARWTAHYVEFPRGSIRVFPSTEHAGLGFTHQLVVFDEFAAHPFALANYSAVRPTLGAGGQMLILSTADPTLGPAGAFYDLWKSTQGIFRRRFVPWMARPGRDREWYDAELAKHPGDERSFRAYNPTSEEDAFAGKGLLVHPDFNEVMHVRAGLPWEQYRWRVAGVDWGGSGDPAAVVPLGVTRDERFHQPGEFFRNVSTTVDDIGGYLHRLHAIAPFDLVACGVDEPVATATLRSMGLPAYPANTKRVEGLGMVDMLLRERRLTIDPACRETQHQFLTYQVRQALDPNTKERYTTKTPVDHHGDLMDAQRYAVMAYWSRSPRPQQQGRELVIR